ncbi:MAG: hypothetical protein GJT30_13550 [Geobacter sp.]|nr:hypothetical protein [Geobacter sp.]
MSRIRLLSLLVLLLPLSACSFENETGIDQDIDLMQTDRYAADLAKREAAAREVAFQSRNGTLPLMPLLYWGKYTYYPSAGIGCIVTVTEKDLNREEIGTYDIDVCGNDEH